MVIARLLTPAEMGIFSVTMVLLMFLATVRDMGAGQYLVQEKDLTTERIRAVWAVQLGLGFSLACLVVVVSYPVAVFYKESRMHDIMLVVALNYVLNPFGAITYAWLMREMRFESVALMRFSAGVGGALTSIWLAWKGFGPISLAYGSLASTVVNAVLAVYYRPKSFPWLPGLAEIRRVVVFGSQLTASSIANTIAGGAPELLLGKLQNITAVGLYSRSNGLVQMFYRLFVDAVNSVCLPWFARHSRQQGGIAESFLKASSYVTAFGWSFCFGMIFLAHPIIRALYGDQWDSSVDLARLLAVAMGFSVPAALCGTALLATGGAAKVARVTAVSAAQGVVLVAIGAFQGLMALGFAMIGAALVGSVLWLHTTSKHIGIQPPALLHVARQSAGVALLAAIGPAAACWVYGYQPTAWLMPLFLGGVGGLAGFLAGILWFKHPLIDEVNSVWLKARS